MKEQIKQISEQRLEICNACPHHSKHHKTKRPDAHCRMCGCTLSARTACLSCSCPAKKWEAHMTDEQYDDILKDLNLNNGNEGEHQNQEDTSGHIDTSVGGDV